MKYFLTREAREEIAAAVEYYESQRSGLGLEFIIDIAAGIAAVLEAPLRWPEIATGLRKFRIKRFPFGLIYRATPTGNLEIYAVFDLRRRPGSWRR